MATKKKKVIKKTVKIVKKNSKPVKKTKQAAKPAKSKTKKPQSKKAVKKVTKKTVKKVSAKPTTAKPTVVKATKPASKVNVDYSKAITPLGDRLVVRLVNAERVTPGGLIIPDSASSVATGYLKATVLAIGVGGKSKKGHLQPLDVKVGDTVLFAEHSGTKVTFNSEELQIIHESDVMGVVQN